MELLDSLPVALGVSADAFSVSVGGAFCSRGARWVRNACLAALFFGGFQFVMPLCGFFAAGIFARRIGSAGNWVAFVLLCFVGGRMIYEGVKTRSRNGTVCGRRGRTPSDALPAPETVLPGAPAGIDTRGESGELFFGWKALSAAGVATSIDAFAVGGGLAFAGKPFFLPCLVMGIVTGAVSFFGVWLGARLVRLSLRPGRALPDWLLLSAGGVAIVAAGVKILLS